MEAGTDTTVAEVDGIVYGNGQDCSIFIRFAGGIEEVGDVEVGEDMVGVATPVKECSTSLK